MTTPTDEKLIAQGPSRGGVREPGSVIEERTAVAENVSLGRVKRTCDVCHKEWIGPDLCHQDGCRSFTFTETAVRPTAMTIMGRGISEVVEPPKPKVAATAVDLFVLRSLRTTLIDSVNRLQEADAQLHQLVNVNETNHEVFGFLQAALHQFTESGDYELRIIDPLKMTALVPVLRGLVAEIDRTLANYEREKNKR
jgi:hypothetical protein